MTLTLAPDDPRARVVTAPAGSGKTELLVRRHLRLLGETTVDRVVAITFTRRAAAELVGRVADVLRATASGALDRDPRLGRFRDVAPDASRAARALRSLSIAPIGTVDSFVLRLLREHALEAHLPLPGGGRAFIDGPARIGGDPAAIYRAAARAELHHADLAARVLLAEAELSEVEDDLAALAAAPLPRLWDEPDGSPAILALAAAPSPDDPAWPPAARARADAVRRALAELAVRVRRAAFLAMASDGVLGFDEALAAATALVSERGAALAGRFDALLVDELQDTSPSQLRFYRAFAALPRADGPIAALFVGDARQSIYRFRHADPYGWREIVDHARARGELATLGVNRRSSRALVDAQAKLFSALAGVGERGVDSLDGVVASHDAVDDGGVPAIQWLDLPAAREPEALPPAISWFAARLRERWAVAPDETAAVLARSWSVAARAARLLREHGVAAELAGDRTLFSSRIAIDLRLILRALLDPSDEVAVIGVLKLPGVGLTDGELARVCRAGPAGRALDDVPALRDARVRLGREPTARVLERLAAAVHLRPILAAGPEGESGVAVAQLDVLLDLVREAEADAVDPFAALDALTASDDGRDPPPLRLRPGDRAGERHVDVTTIHAAKGLEWDHVAVVQLGDGGDPPRRRAKLLRLATPRGAPSIGVAIDPEGALDPQPDPVARRALAVADEERREEGARFLYVAATRARRSVTIAVPRGNFAGDSRADRVRAVLPSIAPGTPAAAVAPLPPRNPTRPRTERVSPLRAGWVDPSSIPVIRPSAIDPDEREPLAEVAIRLVHGVAAPVLPDGASLGRVDLGLVVHAYLERWGLRGDPPLDPSLPGALAAWLVDVGRSLVTLPGFGELAQRELAFEWPLLGAAPDRVYTGRADLVALAPDRRAIVIDFKAGAAPADEAAARAAFDRYAAQLDAYRRLLDAAGHPVVELGLIYPLGPAWIRAPLDRAVD